MVSTHHLLVSFPVRMKKSRRGRKPSGPRPRRLTLRRTARNSRAVLRLVIRQNQIISGNRWMAVPCRLLQNLCHGTRWGERKASRIVFRPVSVSWKLWLAIPGRSTSANWKTSSNAQSFSRTDLRYGCPPAIGRPRWRPSRFPAPVQSHWPTPNGNTSSALASDRIPI